MRKLALCLLIVPAVLTVFVEVSHRQRLFADGIVQVPISWTALNESPTVESGLTDLFLIGRTATASRVYTVSNSAGIHLMTSTPGSTLGSGFPTIPDPLTTTTDPSGVMDNPGDVRRGTGELRQIRRNARQAWQNAFGERPPGILGINVENLLSSGDPAGRTGGIIGLASIARGLRERGGRWFIAEDIQRLPRDARFQILPAHELGHNFSLTHRRFDDTNLMSPTVQDNAPDPPNNFFDNRRLTRYQERQAKRFARGKPGAFVDPPGVFEPGPRVDDERLNDVDGVGNAEHLDLSVARTVLDTEDNIVSFDQELFGLIPLDLNASKYCFVRRICE